MVDRLCLFLCWAASTSSATSSFYSPVGYFGIASEHNGMKYPHQGITITNNNGIVIGGWAGSSSYWSSTYEYTHYPTGMLVSTPGASKGCKAWKCSYLHLANKNQESSRNRMSLTVSLTTVNNFINEFYRVRPKKINHPQESPSIVFLFATWALPHQFPLGLTSTDLESIEAVDEGGSLPEASYTLGVAYSSSNSLIVLAGYTKGNMKQAAGSRFNGDGNTCEYSECTTDAWLAAFNTAGVFQWGRQYSSGQPSEYTAITSYVDMFTAVAVNGAQIWATGHSNEVISSSYTNQGSYDIIRVALYTNGNEINTFQEGSWLVVSRV